jgi:hypothetical protein
MIPGAHVLRKESHASLVRWSILFPALVSRRTYELSVAPTLPPQMACMDLSLEFVRSLAEEQGKCCSWHHDSAGRQRLHSLPALSVAPSAAATVSSPIAINLHERGTYVPPMDEIYHNRSIDLRFWL